jgi:hypothetical protein
MARTLQLSFAFVEFAAHQKCTKDNAAKTELAERGQTILRAYPNFAKTTVSERTDRFTLDTPPGGDRIK